MAPSLLRRAAQFLRSYGVPVALTLAFLNIPGPAHGQLVIVPTYAANITSDPNSAQIIAGIQAMINRTEAAVSNPITVHITYQEGGGLGSSSTFIGNITYTQYLNAIKNNQILSANDNTAIASLPAGPGNPVNGNTNVTLTTPLLRALGFSAVVATDSTITLNTSIMNLSRTGPQNPAFYDLQAVAGHETDEVLGIGGTGSQLPTTNGSIGTLDLYRYSAPGVRSFTTSTNAAPYFSLNGGTAVLVHFNQFGGGSDYSDWGDGVTPAHQAGNSPPQMQDAFGTPNTILNLGTNELTGLDVIGYNLNPVPEPGAMMLTAAGLAAAAYVRRRRLAAVVA